VLVLIKLCLCDPMRANVMTVMCLNVLAFFCLFPEISIARWQIYVWWPRGGLHCRLTARGHLVPFLAWAFLCGVCMSSLWMHGFSLGTPASSKNMHIRLIGVSKLSIGESVWCMVVRLVCLSVALWWTGNLSRMYPASRPMTAGIGSSSPVTLNWIKWV